MTRLPICLALIIALGGSTVSAQEVELRRSDNRVEVTRGTLSLVFDRGGRGFVRSTRLDGREVGAASGASGLFASLIVNEHGTDPLQPIAGPEIFATMAVDSVAAEMANGEAEIGTFGKASFPGVGDAPFQVTIRVPRSGPAMAVSARLQLPAQARSHYLSSFGIAIPLGLTFHPTSETDSKLDRNTAAAAILPRAGTPIPEIRWLVAEQDQKSVWGPMLWTLAGVRQVTPQSMEVWEAWSPVNPMFVLQRHRRHPGWMAVVDGRTAIVAAMPGLDQIAPKEIYADSRAKVLKVCFQSPYCRPLDLRSAPETLSAGPAYVFLENAEPRTRQAEEYGNPTKRPRLAAVGDSIATLAPSKCNFSDAGKTAGKGQAPAEPSPSRETVAPPVPSDEEFSSHEPGPRDAISIWVDNPQDADVDAVPITRGVPLARGVLKDEKEAAVSDAAGRPVPCVTRALAFWPDGSIKWLLVDFQATLKAAGAKFQLVVGARARPAPISKPLEVAQSPGAICVDTGKLKMTVSDEQGRLALGIGLDLNGDGQVSDSEAIVRSAGQVFGCLFSHVEDSRDYRSHVWRDPGRPDPGDAEVTGLRVEEQSPLRAVVVVRANLRHPLLASTIPAEHRPKIGTPVTLRLHLYAGSSRVWVQHTFLFAGDGNHDFLRQLGLRLPLPEAKGRKILTALDGATVGPSAGGPCGVLQENPDAAIVWQTQAQKTGVLQRGRVAEGWLDVSGPTWGVTVGLPRMREMFPEEIEVERDGVWTHFYSPRAVPMDVRRYAFKYGDGESSSTGFGSAFGALRTHEACWYFHPAGEATAAARSQVRALLDRPLARVRPRHVADTLAAGHVAEYGAATSDRHFDAVLYHLPRMHQHNRAFWRWLGFWDFGDEIQVYDAARQRWAKDDGRYGWYNNEPLRDYNYHLAFLMTGNRRIWEQAEAMSYHVFEVDLRHASPLPLMSAQAQLEKQRCNHSTTQGIDLNGRRHNCQHWADGYWGPRVGSPAGFRLCYYQTGDPVMREYLDRLIATALATRRSQYMAADGDEAILWAMIAGYEMTRDARYLERIRGYAHLQSEFAARHQGFPAAQANWDWCTNAPGAPPADPRDDLWIWSFGGHLALVEIADALGDRALDKMLCEWLLALEGFGPDRKRRESWSNHIAACPLLAYYYRRTGDPRALEWFRKRAAGFHSAIPKEAPTSDLAPPLMEDALPTYTPHDGYGWVYCTSTFWYVGLPAWQGALRERAASGGH